MRDILSALDSGNDRTFEVYVHRLRGGIGAMAAGLGDLDALAFTAGVGENAAPVRAAACQGLEFLGVFLSPQANAQCRDADVASPSSSVRILVIRTDEEWRSAGGAAASSGTVQDPSRWPLPRA